LGGETYKNRKSKFKKNNDENTLDAYITKNISKNLWWNKSQKQENKQTESKSKIEFLKKNIKATKIIPPAMKQIKETPDNLGYFETQFGTVSVGYKKYKKNTDVVFSLIPEKVKKEHRIPTRKFDSPSTYFGGEMKGSKKNFKASKLSFKYDEETKKIEKLENDGDGIVDKENKLLYEDKRESEKINELQELRSNIPLKERHHINKEIEVLRDIQEEKKEDNLALIKEIRKFVRKISKGTLKKIIESDEAVVRSQRIANFSNTDDIVLLRKRTEELLKRVFKILGKKFKSIDLNHLNETQLRELINKLIEKTD